MFLNYEHFIIIYFITRLKSCIGGYDAQKLNEGEILVKLECMSVDPYMRSRMSGDGPGKVKTRKYRLLITDKICISMIQGPWMNDIKDENYTLLI